MSASKYKPYPNYKKTGNIWFDKIPDEWNIVKIRRITSEHKQGYYTEQDYINDGIKLVRITDITDGADVDFSKMPFVSITDKEFSDFMVKSGDFLFARSGTIGRFGLVQEPEDSVFASYIIRFRFKEIDSDFMKIYLLSSVFKKQLISNLHGGANKNIHAENIKDVWMARPSYSEQRAIFDFVNPKIKQINETIKGLESEIVLLEEKRLALITQAVTKGLNLSGPIKEINSAWIDSIPEDWINLRIKQIVSTKVTDGPHVTPVQVDEGVPFLSATAVENGRLNMDKMWGYISREDHELYCRKCLPQLEDIFMVKSGATTGSIAFVDFEDEFSVWSPLALIRCDRNKMHPRFVFYSLQSDYLQKAISQTWSKGTQENIAMKAIEELPILKPPLHEQIEIANYIDASTNLIDGLISKTNSMIGKLKGYRTSLISAAVTGKIDVRTI